MSGPQVHGEGSVSHFPRGGKGGAGGLGWGGGPEEAARRQEELNRNDTLQRQTRTSPVRSGGGGLVGGPDSFHQARF